MGGVCGVSAAQPTTVHEDQFYRGLVNGMRCGILTIDREGRLVLMNEPARLILELPDLPVCGTPVEAALGEHPQLAQILRESFSMSSLPNRAEIDLRSRSESGKTIGFTLSLVPGEDGEPMGAAVFFKDLTHVEHKEEQERLRDRLAALGQMAANLAHEIRNPLAAIEVSCSLLKRRLSAETAGRDLLDKIIAEVLRLNRTITSSLEFVRPVSLSLAPARIEPVLDEALNVASGRRGRPGIAIERRFAEGIPPCLMDRGQLRQVFENVFLNAMEAMGEEGMLTIETSLTRAPAAASTPYRPAGRSKGDPWQGFDRYLTVTVSDTGPGIAEEHRDKLFYPFFTTKKQGSGVGLSMAKKIVDSHRGLIDVVGTQGCGAVFTVRIPMVGAAAE
ncbi:MAG: PAS domain-containing protein [Acidobacteriia bacterium]|nr:PAS domain-containing protein [Terriglobia bacterium]